MSSILASSASSVFSRATSSSSAGKPPKMRVKVLRQGAQLDSELSKDKLSRGPCLLTRAASLMPPDKTVLKQLLTPDDDSDDNNDTTQSAAAASSPPASSSPRSSSPRSLGRGVVDDGGYSNEGGRLLVHANGAGSTGLPPHCHDRTIPAVAINNAVRAVESPV